MELILQIKSGRLCVCYFLHLLFALILTLVAESVQAVTVVQPIGTLVQEWDPALVNTYLEKWDTNIVPGVTDPFDTHYPVSEVQPTQVMYFVRLYTSPGSPLGSFIVRPSVIRGLTPEQIRNVLALPSIPTNLVYVKMLPGAQYGIWTGVAGPINTPTYPWGQGGGEQTKIIGKETNASPPADPARFADYSRLPSDSYINPQSINVYALSYAQAVTGGNASKVAAYLDKHLPVAYSDLESVYTTLDFISADGPLELASALRQTSPINYDAYSIVEFRNDLLFEHILFEHVQNNKIPSGKTADSKASHSSAKGCFASWINVTGEQGEQTSAMDQVGFSYQTGLLAGGVDCEIYPQLNFGIGAGYLQDHVGWNSSAGNASIYNAKLGIYANYLIAEYFFKGAITNGFSWSSAQRHIDFSGVGLAALTGLVTDVLDVNRTAVSHPTGQNLGLYLMGGKKIKLNTWKLKPLAMLSYFYSRQGGFDETGANDINLSVEPFNAQTIRMQLAMVLDKVLNLKPDVLIETSLKLGWAHNFPLDHRTIRAGLVGLDGSFSVNGNSDETNELLAGAKISGMVNKKTRIAAQYYADLSHGFNSQTFLLLLNYYLDN